MSQQPISFGVTGRLHISALLCLVLLIAGMFAVGSLLTGLLGGGHMAMMCSTAQDASPLSGMVPMYVLMSAFHSAPWLKLISARCWR